ncbi:MAG: hypothetical protein MJE77_06665 [Proteobacteria bacterium]|nr:hypothetical protein [Pseudomonadota bacterium]
MSEWHAYRIEWWYADGHGITVEYGATAEQAEARFWRRFKPYLPMAYQEARVTQTV